VVAVPANLCVKLAPNAELSRAAFNTLGAIAMQGVRQSNLHVGETCFVIGLGLLGQITCQILKVAGINVVGLDIDPAMISLAREHCEQNCYSSKDAGIAESIDDMTGGLGADCVIITAASSSLEPINLAGRLLRKRGEVVVVGAVPTGFDRDPYFYRKEISLKMSCSYGPGRYDINYEEKGIDYPAAFVRWTENRNMLAFQELLQSGKIDVNYLISHRFNLDRAPDAYDLIVAKSEPYLGILIEYDVDKVDLSNNRVTFREAGAARKRGELGVAFIGAGSYAMGHLLPNVVKQPGVSMTGVMTSSGSSSRTVGEKYNFEFCTSDDNEIWSNQATDVVFVATRHNSHAGYVEKALSYDKHVFVEKPLCMDPDELEIIKSTYEAAASGTQLMVGFNRRFAPLVQTMRESLGSGPMSVIYRVNAGAVPMDSWIQDKTIGGGRIVGEVCHFIDFIMYLTGALPLRVYASGINDNAEPQDIININLDFSDGSIGTIAYYANGARSVSKEYVEAYATGRTAILTDYKSLVIHGGSKPLKKSLLNQDKGQARMIEAFISACKGEQPAPIRFEEVYLTTLATFRILESLRTRECAIVQL
jgi:predicted dehydrogenase/NADPH:quinone reductase-like Zn-dependent oxidoreductase